MDLSHYLEYGLNIQGSHSGLKCLLETLGWSRRGHSPGKMPGSFIISSVVGGAADHTKANISTGWTREGDKSQKAENRHVLPWIRAKKYLTKSQYSQYKK